MSSQHVAPGDGAPPGGRGTTVRILTLGDGNFSFSVALAKSLLDTRKLSRAEERRAKKRAKRSTDGGEANQAPAAAQDEHTASLPRVSLVATSFDEHDELLAKFPEAKAFLDQIQALGGVTAHGVDATAVPASLYAALQGACEEPFDHVVFNNPHTGIEDMHRHRSLLAHFFHAASQQSVLAPHGIVHVSLAGDQPKRWKIVEQAQRHGLALLDSRAFPTPGLRGIYEPKRHHTGRSFQGRGLAGTSWSFGRAAEFPDVALGGLSGWRRPPWTWRDAPSKAATGSAEALTCPECGREFRDPRGLKQHIHMVHTLGVARLNEGGGHPCPHCEKDLGSPEALDQHVRAKHGGDAESLKPDWIGKVRDDRPGHVSAFATGGGAPGAVIACGVCGYDFASKEELDQHMANLKPVQAAEDEFLCPECKRPFPDNRALRQHLLHSDCGRPGQSEPHNV